MMDSFVEQIVSKRSETKDTLKRFAFVFGGSVLFIISLFGMLWIGAFSLLIGFGALFLAWYFIQSTFIEYEYIITNHEMDIDKIIAKKRRKRLITIKINKAEAWGEYTEGKENDALVTVQAHDCGYKNLWYIITVHEKHGKTAVLFSPNNSVLEAMNKSVPHSLRKKELKERKNEVENEN
jgi:hypothetical protein